MGVLVEARHWSVRVLSLSCIIGALICSSTFARDWPQWMGGPSRINTAPAPRVTGVRVTQIRTVWKTTLGSGYSAVSIAGSNAAVMFSNDRNDVVGLLDAGTGEEKWRFELDEMYKGHDGSISGPLSTPAIDDTHVYAISGHGQFAAINLKTGKPSWRIDLKKEFRARPPYFGFACSPLIDGDQVTLLFRGKDNHGLWSFDKKTGSLRWSAGGKRKIEYSSPTAVTIDGVRQIIGVTDRAVFAVNAKDGKELWTLPCKTDKWATVHALPDNRLFLPMKDKFRMVEITKSAGDWATKEIWSRDEFGPNSSFFSYVDGYLYGSTQDALVCLDATSGDVKWKEPMGAGAAIAVGDKLVALDRKKKKFRVATLTPKGYQRQIDQVMFQSASQGNWTMPIAANGLIYLRNAETFMCVQLASQGS